MAKNWKMTIEGDDIHAAVGILTALGEMKTEPLQVKFEIMGTNPSDSLSLHTETRTHTSKGSKGKCVPFSAVT